MIPSRRNALRDVSEITQIFRAALDAVDPRRLVGLELRLSGQQLQAGSHSYNLDEFSRIIVVGAGKAASGMGLAVESVLGDRIAGGLLALPQGVQSPLRIIPHVQASHPLPDRKGERAAEAILAMLGRADEKNLVLCLLSGGASALLAAPALAVTLGDKRTVTELLLQAGAGIDELNAVRKHLSRVKGGWLAAAAFPAPLFTLSLSDVVGDRPDVIASGPTVADSATFADALAVVDKYGLVEKTPERARAFLQRGAAGLEAETLKPGDPRLARAAYRLIGSNRTALDAARGRADGLGWSSQVAPNALVGEARDAGRLLAARALRLQAGWSTGERLCLLSGGETTVTVRGSGRGGRNQELALAFALEISGKEGIEMLSAGTDGVDGPTDAAGAVVDGRTSERAARYGLDAAAYLDKNDSYSFFSELDRLGGGQSQLKTGPTGTNVGDLQIILVRRTD